MRRANAEVDHRAGRRETDYRAPTKVDRISGAIHNRSLLPGLLEKIDGLMAAESAMKALLARAAQKIERKHIAAVTSILRRDRSLVVQAPDASDDPSTWKSGSGAPACVLRSAL
ncbi:MAG TPA: hypothetical protein VFG23_01500 [Polyangia bacterium]|nr:hypothetical protein [Polyangia bacterium]